MVERERLLEDVKHFKVASLVSGSDVDAFYAELGIVQEDNHKMAAEHHWLLSQRFGCFLSAYAQSAEFKGSLERIDKAYWDVGYQARLKDAYPYLPKL
ncbi:hypothetical protein HanPI659440_Chr11g0409741 [Helianthus annuus]|nr:hypothetical protein HanLR1_Chr11g0390581 [Helianthus annuus]KAJ0733567.1 hypothetical protein HanPI659440_Chr11g0409741 [Helianthus annuus]KAJ0873978.1 hypothetical protein HanPSC8_Chr11g0458781 [Helianthus annuus]